MTPYGDFILGLIIFLIIDRISGVSYNQPKFCNQTTWNPNAITFATSTTVGEQPYSLFVDTNNSVYVSNREDLVIKIWSNGSVNPTRTLADNLTYPRSVFAASNGDVYVDSGDQGRVVKWSLNSTGSVTVMNFSGICFGLFIDIQNNLYCSVGFGSRVERISLNSSTKTTTTVAGNGINGSTSYLLNNPRGVFVDVNLNLYVADSSNGRIQLFRSGKLNGTTVAGGTVSKNFTLITPHGIVLDADGYLFIVDSGNDRIIRSGPNGFQCIVGCVGEGSSSNKLSFPQTMAFDSFGNIFVTDRNNDRVQKFLVATNSCKSLTTISPITTMHTTQTTKLTTAKTIKYTTAPATTTKRITAPATTVKHTTTLAKTQMTGLSTVSMATQTAESTTGETVECTTTSEQSQIIEQLTELSTVQVTGETTEQSTIEMTEETTELSTIQVTEPTTESIPFRTPGQTSDDDFVPSACPDTTRIGTTCDVSILPCDVLQPCQNNGICSNTDTTSYGYQCECSDDFSGINCEINHRLCDPNPCWNDGNCSALNTTYDCTCISGWEGSHCETQINYCGNITCLNYGVCRPLLRDFKCECLNGSFYGVHCEITTTRVIVFRIVSKSFAFIAILAMTTVVTFVVVMDVLKYFFGVDPVHQKRMLTQQMQQEKQHRSDRIGIIINIIQPSTMPEPSV